MEITNAVATHLHKLCKLAPFDNSDFGNVPRTSDDTGINTRITPTPIIILGIAT